MTTEFELHRTVDGSETASGRPPLALLRLGFRPFYLLAGVFALLSIPLWLSVYFGLLPLRIHYPYTLWHAHEMLYGFTIAVIAGFLFTAVPNWTSRATPRGGLLAAFVLLWLAGRLFMSSTLLPAAASAAIDFAFLPALALALLLPILQAGNYRNLGIVAIVLALAVSNGLFHLAMAGYINYVPLHALALGLALVVLMMIVMGGRVIPAFTANALPDSGAHRVQGNELPTLIASTGVVIVLALPALHFLLPAILLLAGLLNALRMRTWGTVASLASPILWILHIAYIWIIIGLILAGLSIISEFVPQSAALHALGTGAVASMTLGMMTRTALGHSGRPLRVAPAITGSYILISLSAAVRVGSTIMPPAWQTFSLAAAALAWVLAFAIFVYVYWPICAYPRIDGKPG